MWVFVFESRIFNLLYHHQLRQQLEENSEVVELQRRVADLQEKLREQKQRTREHEEALRSAGGAGKSGETPSVEASAQIDSKVGSVCPCLSSNNQFTLLHVCGTVAFLHAFPPPRPPSFPSLFLSSSPTPFLPLSLPFSLISSLPSSPTPHLHSTTLLRY